MFTMHMHFSLLPTLVKSHKYNSAILSKKVILSPCLIFLASNTDPGLY